MGSARKTKKKTRNLDPVKEIDLDSGFMSGSIPFEVGSTKDVKPGYQTTEFWMSLLLVAGGIYMSATGQQEVAAGMIVAGGATYTVSRAVVKKNGG